MNREGLVGQERIGSNEMEKFRHPEARVSDPIISLFQDSESSRFSLGLSFEFVRGYFRFRMKTPVDMQFSRHWQSGKPGR